MISAAPAAAPTPQAPQRKPCLIVNAKSFRASRGSLAARAIELVGAYGADVIPAERPCELAAAMAPLLARRQEHVFLLAGDGTVQALVDQLAMLPEGAQLPRLLILGGGRSNLTAGDLGGRGAVLKKLESALRRWHSGEVFEVEDRHTLRIEQAPAPPRHGFFVAAGLVDSVIRACHRRRAGRDGLLRNGHAGTAWSLLTLAVSALLGRRPLPLADLRIDAAGCEALRGRARLLIATTLQRRHGLLHPYAERGEGGVRITAVAAGAFGLWHCLPRLLAGRFTDRMTAERGYLSGRCERLQVLGLTGYTLDGEEFDADPARPVVIRKGPRISFLKL